MTDHSNGCIYVCKYTKNYWIVCFKWANGTVRELNINKTVIKLSKQNKILDRILAWIHYLWFLVPFLPHSKLFLEFFLQAYTFPEKDRKIVLLVQIFQKNRLNKKEQITGVHTRHARRGILSPNTDQLYFTPIYRDCPLAAPTWGRLWQHPAPGGS